MSLVRLTLIYGLNQKSDQKNLLCCVDDILGIHCNADTMLEQLHKSFPLEPGFGNPDMYIGAKLHNTKYT